MNDVDVQAAEEFAPCDLDVFVFTARVRDDDMPVPKFGRDDRPEGHGVSRAGSFPDDFRAGLVVGRDSFKAAREGQPGLDYPA